MVKKNDTVWRSEKWYADYFDASGVRCRPPLSPFLDKAKIQLIALLQARDRERSTGEPALRKYTLGHLYDMYNEHLAERERGEITPAHATDIRFRLQAILNVLVNWRTRPLTRLTIPVVERFVASVKSSPTTRHRYIVHLKAWFNWLVTSHKLPVSPFASLSLKDWRKGQKKRRRRALTIVEMKSLLLAARERGEATGNKRKGLDRAMTYLALYHTGLRVSELAAVRPNWIETVNGVLMINMPSDSTKNRLAATVPIVDLELVEYVRRRKREFVFHVPQSLLHRFYADLKCAGIERVDVQGRTVDLHSLRRTLATHLAEHGVAPKVAQSIMRHQDIGMTMDTYTDQASLKEKIAALSSLSMSDDIISVRAKYDAKTRALTLIDIEPETIFIRGVEWKHK